MKDYKNHDLYSFGLHDVRVVIEQLKFWKKWQKLTIVQQILVQQIHINKHQQRYKQELIGDRIGITKYPTFVFFDTDNKMYFYNESTNIGNFTQFYMKRNIYIQNLMKLQKKLIIQKMIKKNILMKNGSCLCCCCFYSSFDILKHLLQQTREKGQIGSQKSKVRIIQKIIRVIRKGRVPQEKKRLNLLIGQQFQVNKIFILIICHFINYALFQREFDYQIQLYG
ncbi:unnamed protein product [Paramecium primaurelia]|uniref:Uncharacterized protein n=1 Tax=Paramecium primaurelia TaxID=5886 RepID=A0A8S1L1Z9_PARPR|nr:unnamed protein product [Paramecium primaurelia]